MSGGTSARAELLLRSGCVEVHWAGDSVYGKVIGSNGVRHTVSWAPDGRMSCTCTAGQHGSPCSHALAVRLYVERQGRCSHGLSIGRCALCRRGCP
jgi:uncharacterized Zn finger protein